jgi:hypothetical protein
VAVIEVRALTNEDREWATAYQATTWGSPLVARRGQLVDTSNLPALVADLDGERAGLLAYAVRGQECEIVTLATSREDEAWAAHCSTPFARSPTPPDARGSG